MQENPNFISSIKTIILNFDNNKSLTVPINKNYSIYYDGIVDSTIGISGDLIPYTSNTFNLGR
jgi:hypothetical protein